MNAESPMYFNGKPIDRIDLTEDESGKPTVRAYHQSVQLPIALINNYWRIMDANRAERTVIISACPAVAGVGTMADIGDCHRLWQVQLRCGNPPAQEIWIQATRYQAGDLVRVFKAAGTSQPKQTPQTPQPLPDVFYLSGSSFTIMGNDAFEALKSQACQPRCDLNYLNQVLRTGKKSVSGT